MLTSIMRSKNNQYRAWVTLGQYH